MTPALLLSLVTIATPMAGAATPCSTTVPVLPAERDAETHLRQARHFEKKGWLEDAVREVAMARSTESGSRDPEVFALAARLARSRDDIVGARCMAEATLALQRSGRATEAARALLTELDRSFGYLTIDTSGDAATASLRVQPPKLFATAALKSYADRQVQALRSSQVLPIEVALPAGAYVVNGESITVLPGRHQDLTLHPRRTRPGWASPIARVAVGATLRGDQPHTPPPLGGSVDLTTTWPVVRGRTGALHAGARAGATRRTTLASGTEVPAGGDLGLQLAGSWVSTIGVELRADASVGWASLSGVGVSCPLDGSACTAEASPSPPADRLVVRTGGLQVRGGVGAELRRFGDLDWLGIGAAVAYVHTRGQLAPSGVGGAPLPEVAWTVRGLAPMVTVSVRR